MGDAPKASARSRIAILVSGKCENDGRVIKGAESLAARGFDVMVFAQSNAGAEGLSERNGVRYRRIPKRKHQERTALLQTSIFHKAEPVTIRKQLDDAIDDARSLWRLATLLWRIRRSDVGSLPPEDQRAGIVSLIEASARSSTKSRRKPNSRLSAEPGRSDGHGGYESILDRYGAAVRVFGPSLIHSHDLDCLEAAAELSAVIGCPFIYDVHELETGRQVGKGEEWRTPAAKLEVAYIRKSSAVVTVSDQLASRLNEIYGVRPLVIYNTPRSGCLDPAGRHVRDDLKLGPETPLAVHTGQIASSRDIERFLHQMPRVPDLHFALVGMANKRMAARFGKLSRELDISARVHFVPPVPYDDVSPYISSASFGVVPAVAASESQIVAAPGKLFEMMFAGLPVLMADMPQRRSMLERYGEGVIFPNDPDIDMLPFIERIVARCKDPSWRASCRAKALAAAELIGWEQQMAVLDRLYAELLAPSVVSPS